MLTVFANQQLPQSNLKSIMLCGPTPRSPEVKSWRPEALSLLEKFGFEGIVYVPEQSDWVPRCGQESGEYEHQIEWELAALTRADVILFWIPRQLDTMPAFTTNVEFGWWMNSGKIVLGSPDQAPKVSYLRWHAVRLGIPLVSTLEETIKLALKQKSLLY